MSWALLFACCIVSNGVVVIAATTSDEDQPQEEEEDDVALLKETISAGRGNRDEVGKRDQWESNDHLGRKYDMRKPISDRVKSLLRTYRLSCDGCDEKEAVAKINAFVLETKRQTEEQARRKSWWENLVLFVTVVAAGIGGAYLYSTNAPGGQGKLGVGSVGAGQSKRLREIEEQRRRAAKKEEEAKRMAAIAREAPTWRDNEEKEVWTDKQEKQFAISLKAFGGVPAKARYTLIADKVDGKTRQECLMHHKLLQLIAHEKSQGH
eukprot:CAMPEP_0117051334 /NCGR_PEP_ID=MMETSP0472-20121206/35461_1 /TAXON_ID=693140 ORGANISM="Tiarina fusus, Strain LIS" /NCGR_SAMPLE_ID=MMETSP0472 /ASSEMBLY_ACC=CAM_ASM_000603 /LENGTH=264 /DNA_ID=CAMNT_0004765493 /DNA_START=49 /DNA_END=843 /DNA_ORIENTATION=-